jgi:hypothetical protein
MAAALRGKLSVSHGLERTLPGNELKGTDTGQGKGAGNSTGRVSGDIGSYAPSPLRLVNGVRGANCSEHLLI